MAISLADLDRWEPGSIRAVATAATNRADHFRDVAHNQGAIIAKLEWEGASQDAAAARAQTISNSLLKHADECHLGRRRWHRLTTGADAWGGVAAEEPSSVQEFVKNLGNPRILVIADR